MAIGKEAVDQIEQALPPKIKLCVDNSSDDMFRRLVPGHLAPSEPLTAGGRDGSRQVQMAHPPLVKSRSCRLFQIKEHSPTDRPRSEVILRPWEGVALDPDLQNYAWFHGDLNREASRGKLMSHKKDGMYLVRNSSHRDFRYCLCVYYKAKVYWIPIRWENNHFFVGEKRIRETVSFALF